MGSLALPSPEQPITFRLAERRFLATIETGTAQSLSFDAFPDGEAVSTSLENALCFQLRQHFNV
jgi:sarcosine oxidase gamma subunit